MSPALETYDWIVLNSSAGKDSQAMTDYVCELARRAGLLHRVVIVHADLGRVEWKGTKELAQEHADHYGVRFEVVRRTQNDLLKHIAARGMFPDNHSRYCTSEHKRGPVSTLFTRLRQESGRHVRILNCMGIRADESASRSKKLPFQADKRNTNGKRAVDLWYPIFQWTTAEVWARIRSSGVRYHYAYDLGMPRLSCCFCIFAPPSALLLAGKHNRELLNEYVAVEQATGHSFRHNFSLAEISRRLDAGEQPEHIQSWAM